MLRLILSVRLDWAAARWHEQFIVFPVGGAKLTEELIAVSL